MHSPLVGPSRWRWVAEELAERGHVAKVPAPPPDACSRSWQAFAASVAAQARHNDHAILVGHSGAGPLLPQIKERAGWTSGALIFADAGVPPQTGEAELRPAEILADLRALARDGMLPPWSDWFGPDVMDELVPDGERRAVIGRELPRLPLSYFEDHVPAPVGWDRGRCGYLQLSEPYGAEAAARGWPVLRRLGAHLDIVRSPVVVADALLSLASLLGY